jgi:C1A family cysteine protease
VVDRDFKLQSNQAKDYSNGSCWIFANHVALMSKDWLTQNQDNVFECRY